MKRLTRPIPRSLRAPAPRSRPLPPCRPQHNNNTNGNKKHFHNKIRDSSAETAPATSSPQSSPAQQEASHPPRQNVTTADILARRATAGHPIFGTAAYSDSDMFKVRPATTNQPRALRMDHHLSAESAVREPCVLKQAAKHLKQPGLISLGGGLPCAENFPFESITVRVPSFTKAAADGGGSGEESRFSEEATRALGVDIRVGKYDARDGVPGLDGSPASYDLSIALNYGQANGSAQLMRWVTEHTEFVGTAPPYADWRSCLTVGSTAALEQALRMLGDRSRGDAILTEEYSFSTAVETAMPLGLGVFGVPMDKEGLLPEAMDDLLRTWDRGERGGARKPHVLYTVPSGQNPTGATQGEGRRREIYEVARRHDVFILEDEPYYFLQMPAYRRGKGMTEAQTRTTSKDQSVEEFLASLIPTILSMDVDGRVLRMDSFSKVVVPGARLGWVTGSEQIIERYLRHAEVCNQGPSGFSQVVLHALLDGHWGHEGYLRWLMHLRDEYTRRRDVMLAACDEFLPEGVVSWEPPMAGMFHWLKVDHTQHPDAGSKSILEIEEDIFNLCISKGVLASRGSWFRAEHNRPPKELFFRATFAAATPDNMTEAIRRFGEAIRESYRMV